MGNVFLFHGAAGAGQAVEGSGGTWTVRLAIDHWEPAACNVPLTLELTEMDRALSDLATPNRRDDPLGTIACKVMLDDPAQPGGPWHFEPAGTDPLALTPPAGRRAPAVIAGHTLQIEFPVTGGGTQQVAVPMRGERAGERVTGPAASEGVGYEVQFAFKNGDNVVAPASEAGGLPWWVRLLPPRMSADALPSLEDLVRLYVAEPAEAPITVTAGGASHVYSAEWLGSDVGVACMRGGLRSRLAAIGGDAAALQRTRALFASRSGDAAQDLQDLIAEAEQRAHDLHGAAQASAPAFVDAGTQGRTWTARSGISRICFDCRHARSLHHPACSAPGCHCQSFHEYSLDGRIHAAMDVVALDPAVARTAVFAPLAGRVLRVGWSSTYGNHVQLRCEDPASDANPSGPPFAPTADDSHLPETSAQGPVVVNFGHLDEVLVEEGVDVYAGQAIGMMGQTGLAHNAPHTHWSVMRIPADGSVPPFASSMEERADLRVHPGRWLWHIGCAVASRSAPRRAGTHPRLTRSLGA